MFVLACVSIKSFDVQRLLERYSYMFEYQDPHLPFKGIDLWHPKSLNESESEPIRIWMFFSSPSEHSIYWFFYSLHVYLKYGKVS